MITFRPCSAVFIASFSVLTIVATRIAAHRAQPFDAHGAQRLFDVHAGRRAVAARHARRDVLLAGGGGVAVLHHDQHAVAFVEQVRGDAGDQPVMPEAAVAHDRDRALLHVGRDRRGAGQRHAVAEDRVAERERREGRERMAADIGADMGRPQFALHQLDGGKHRALRAAGAEGGRARRQRPERCRGFRLVRDQAARRFRHGVGVEAIRLGVLQKGGQALRAERPRCIRRPAAAAPCRARGSGCRRGAIRR